MISRQLIEHYYQNIIIVLYIIFNNNSAGIIPDKINKLYDFIHTSWNVYNNVIKCRGKRYLHLLIVKEEYLLSNDDTKN